jgi:hypothetical protein
MAPGRPHRLRHPVKILIGQIGQQVIHWGIFAAAIAKGDQLVIQVAVRLSRKAGKVDVSRSSAMLPMAGTQARTRSSIVFGSVCAEGAAVVCAGDGTVFCAAPGWQSAVREIRRKEKICQPTHSLLCSVMSCSNTGSYLALLQRQCLCRLFGYKKIPYVDNKISAAGFARNSSMLTVINFHRLEDCIFIQARGWESAIRYQYCACSRIAPTVTGPRSAL